MILCIMLLAATGMATAGGVTNSKQKRAWELERVSRALIREEGGATLRGDLTLDGKPVERAYAGPVTLNCTRKPALDGTGAWEVRYNHDYGYPTESIIYLMCKDWSSEYSVLYYKEYSYAISSATSCRIVSGGDYQMVVYAYFPNVGGYYTATYTFSINDDAAHTSLQEKVNAVAASCKASTAWKTAVNLHDWLVKHVYYDLNYEYYGADMILRGYGVCDGYSKAYCMLCKAAGITVARVTGDAGGSHAWNAIRLGGSWYYVDPTWDDPAGSTSAASGQETHTYFCLNEELMGLDHYSFEWAGMSKQKCTALKCNYYVHEKDWNGIGNRTRTSSGTMTTYSALIAGQIAGNRGGNSVAWGDFYYVTSSSGWNTDYSNEEIRRGWTLLAYAMSKEPMTIAGFGDIQIEVTCSPDHRSFIYVVKGYDVEETGTLTLPKKLKTIGKEAFRAADASTVVIPNGCTKIGAYAFAYSNVRQVHIPDSVTSIDKTAFAGCSQVMIFCSGKEGAVKSFATQNNMLWTYEP